MWRAAQVTERFSFNRETTMQRRDLRGGEQRARLLATPDGLLASIRWGDPHAGGSRVQGFSPCLLQIPEAPHLNVSSVYIMRRTRLSSITYLMSE